MSYIQNEIIDISRYQEPSQINYNTLAQNTNGVILRAGISAYTPIQYLHDLHFEHHYAQLRARNVPMGAYYYSRAMNVTQARLEADKTLELIAGKQFEFPIWFDMEENSVRSTLTRQQMTDIAKAYLQRVEDAGYYVGFYSYHDWFKDHIYMDQLSDFDFWVAKTEGGRPDFRHGLWQYTHTGSIAGLNGNVDKNRAYKNYPKIIKDAGLNGFSKSPDTYPFDRIYINGSAAIQGYTAPDWGGQYGPIKPAHVMIFADQRADIGDNSFVRDRLTNTWYWVRGGTSWKVRGGWSPELGSSDGYYYVRKTWDNYQSQVGAYRSYSNARNHQKTISGYDVFAPDGSLLRE